MLKDLKVSRRMALRGALAGTGIAMWLPVLDAMTDENGEAFAQGGDLPVPFGLWFWGNGVYRDHYIPSGNGFTLEQNMTSFAPVKEKMQLLTGLNMLDGGFRGHGAGSPYVIAGGNHSKANRIQDIDFGRWGFELNTSSQTLPTIDQVIADHYQEMAPAPFKSLHTGTLAYTGLNMGTVGTHLSHRGPDDPLPIERNPANLYDRLFADANAPATPSALPSEIFTALRLSSLDAVNEEVKKLQMRVGAVDSQRLDAHLTGIRDIENRIESLAQPSEGGAGACSTPPNPGNIAVNDRMRVTERTEALNRLLVSALSCNLTNVFSHMWSGPRDDNTYPAIDINEEHHSLTHRTNAEQLRASVIAKFILEHLSDLAQVMDQTPMGDGTLLDRSMVYAVTEVANPRDHRHNNYVMMLLGRAGGKLAGNKHTAFGAVKKGTQVQLAMLQTLGLPITNWGNWDNTSDPAEEILA